MCYTVIVYNMYIEKEVPLYHIPDVWMGGLNRRELCALASTHIYENICRSMSNQRIYKVFVVLI